VSKVLHHRRGQMGAKFGRHAKFFKVEQSFRLIPALGSHLVRRVFILGNPRGYGVGDRG
jgi:hypothetical protein